MKKILGIAILTFMLSVNAHGKILKFSCDGVNVDNEYLIYELDTDNNSLSFILKKPGQKEMYEEAAWVNINGTKITYGLSYSGTNYKYEFDYGKNQFTDYQLKPKRRAVQRCRNEQSQEENTQDKIAQSKQICRDLGFKVNSEKFADCALKMMSIQFEATNKVASGSGTKQEIIVKHKQDYDIWDAMLDMSNALSGSSSNNNSSSSGSSGTRCVIQKTHAWGHTVMNCN